MVYRLYKDLYGLRKAPRAWNIRLDKILKDLGFTRCSQEQPVYKLHRSNTILIVGVYVDDLIVIGSNEDQVTRFIGKMQQVFDMSDLGMLTYYLGVELRQSEKGIEISQAGYANGILQTAGMWDCNPTKWSMDEKFSLSKNEEGTPVNATNYRQLIGRLRYLTYTRPDLAYSFGVASRYMSNPKAI
ncbi:uncharacterized mitochondrial protein AtMg00810-like [Andrographis paniculata]|uniref:uncharacterized mitochondrial protein AtMg00810-like n=1 Tax=Andrographis paniculata TaxID=175694 RepID=UPI0021E73342|nr:uncharacterized mitochondrial protein AtMg00810-like [Andrographis paniculata]